MGLLDFLFKNKKQVQVLETNKSPAVSETELQNFFPIEPYIEATYEENKLISIITVSTVGGDFSNSEYIVKRVLKRNPEAKKIGIIVASLATSESKESTLLVKSIKKRKED